MKKIEKIKIMMVLELALNIFWIYVVSFTLRPFTFTVIDNRIFNPIQDNILHITSNIILFMIQCLCVSALLLRKVDNSSIKRFFKIFFTKILFNAFMVRLIVDIVFMILESLPYALFSGSIKIVAEAIFYWYLFNLLTRKLQCNFDNAKSKKSTFIIGCVWVAGFTSIHLLYTFLFLKNQEGLYAKYVDATIYTDIASSEFKLQLINLIFNIGLVIMLSIYFDLFKVNEKKIVKYSFTKFAVRSLIWLYIGVQIFSAKMVILPHDMFYVSGVSSSNTQSYSPSSYDNIRVDYSTFYIERYKNYDIKEKTFQITKIYLQHGNDKVLSFNSKKSEDISKPTKINVSTLKYACRYDFDAIAFIDPNNRAFAIETKDINSYNQKDDNLIVICEQLIDDGYFEMFELSYEYLLKHDEDYIKTFVVEQQQSGWDAFYCNETNEHLHFDYISNALEKIESNLIDLLKL